MAENTPFGLNYGHFGEPVFDSGNERWIFQRDLSAERVLQGLDASYVEVVKQEVTGTTLRNESANKTTSDEHSRRSNRAAAHLIKERPEVITDLAILSELISESEAVTAHTTAYDATRGDLLAIGIARRTYNYHVPVDVAAVVHGPTGSSLLLIEGIARLQGWNVDQKVGLDTLSWAGNRAIWQGKGAPILQVAFSDEEDSAQQYLAARHANSISIFEPKLYKGAMSSSEGYTNSSSALQLDPLFSVPLDQPGQSLFAHVSFNPWYKQQFAVVAENGHWAIHEIQSKTKRWTGISRTVASIVQNYQGQDKTDDDHVFEEEMSVPDDKWARILWISDVHTIAVCRRRVIQLFDISTTPPRAFDVPSLELNQTPHWVLDTQAVRTHADVLVVLTSVNIFLVHMQGLKVSESSGIQPGGRVLMTWKHFLDQNDITLNLALASHDANRVLIVVHSAMNPLLTILHIRIDKGPGGYLQASTHGAKVTSIRSLCPNIMDASRKIRTLSLSPMRYVERSSDEVEHPYEKSDILFFQVTVIFDDLSVHHFISYSTPENDQRLPSFTWSRDLRHHQKSDLLVLDSFGDDEMSEAELLQRDKNQATYDGTTPPNWAVDNSSLYATATSRQQQTEGLSTLANALQQLNLELERDGGSAVEGKTLLEALGFVVSSDINAASLSISRLLEASDNRSEPFEDDLEARPIVSGPLLAIQGPSASSAAISQIYDTIMRHWLTPLRSTISPKVRFAKEAVARKAAIEIALSSVRLRLQHEAEGEIEPLHTGGMVPSQGESATSFSLPIRPPDVGRQKGPIGVSSSQPTLPASGQTNTQLPTLATTPPKTLRSHSIVGANAVLNLSALKQHIRIDKSPASVPASMIRVLSHWDIGADPATYNYEAKKAELDEDENENEMIAPQAKRKIQKRMRRHLKQQRRQNAPTSSQAPVVMSQPAIPPTFGSSQIMSTQAESQPVMASQLEKGRFGGRPPEKKRKIRQLGF